MNKTELTHLLESGEFPGKTGRRRLIETHISWVILAGDFVYKLKKPMKYDFLDFSTLEQRRYYCAQEVALNRRLTDDVYLGVVPVRQIDGELHIGPGDGPVIDYAVKMRKLQARKHMPHMLDNDAVTPAHMRALATRVAAFHRTATVVATPFDAAQAAHDFNDIRSVRDFVAQHLGAGYAGFIDGAVAFSDGVLHDFAELFAGRVRQGFQRDVHGDLHAKNIFLYNAPVIFDCIEFNEHFRQIDLLSEIAFLCMDLDASGHDELAYAFLNHYLDELADIEDLFQPVVFAYYLCYRANVRAKVNALRAMQESSDKGRQRWLAATAEYLRLMERYAVLPASDLKPPFLVSSVF